MNSKHVRRLFSIAFAVVLVFCFSVTDALASDQGVNDNPSNTVSGGDIDWNTYTLDELLALQTDLGETILERQRQYAIENGNRTISFDQNVYSLYSGSSVSLSPTITRNIDDAPEITTLLWQSSDSSVVKVDQNGKATGVSPGRATITCTARDDEFIFSSVEIKVVSHVKTISLSETSLRLLMDNPESVSQASLSIAVSPEDAYYDSMEWTSSNPKVAVVDESGTITAIAPGKATITVSVIESGSKKGPKASCTVTVVQAVTSLEISEQELTMIKNSSHNLTVTVLPKSATNKAVLWESSNPYAVTVSNTGRVSAVRCGTATVTCTAVDGVSVSTVCRVTVIQPVTGLRLTESGSVFTINVNQRKVFSVSVTPVDATNKRLHWSSSDPQVATVSDHGSVLGIGGGTATITCTADDGSGKSISFKVFVPSIAAVQSYTVKSKDGLKIPVKIYGNINNFSYSVSNPNLFTVSDTREEKNVTLLVSPRRAGTGYIDLKDSSDSKNNIRITVIIDHSAVYDTTAYPTANYEDILRYPSNWNGKPVSIYGRVLQVSEGWFSTTLRVGTAGYGYYDKVFYIDYSNSLDFGMNIIEDDYITIYGTCTGTETYSSLFGNRITIPSISPEMIYLGRN